MAATTPMPPATRLFLKMGTPPGLTAVESESSRSALPVRMPRPGAALWRRRGGWKVLAGEEGGVEAAAAVGVFDAVERGRLGVDDAGGKVDAGEEADGAGADGGLVVGEEGGGAGEGGGDFVGGLWGVVVAEGGGGGSGLGVDGDDLAAAVARWR